MSILERSRRCFGIKAFNETHTTHESIHEILIPNPGELLALSSIQKIPSGGTGVGPDNSFFSSTYQTKGRVDLPRDAMDPFASRGGSVPDFLGKHMDTCDFPGGGGVLDPQSPHLDPPMAARINKVFEVDEDTQ